MQQIVHQLAQVVTFFIIVPIYLQCFSAMMLQLFLGFYFQVAVPSPQLTFQILLPILDTKLLIIVAD